MSFKKSLKLFGLDFYFNELTSIYNNNNFPNKILLSGRGRKNAGRYPMRVFFYMVCWLKY